MVGHQDIGMQAAFVFFERFPESVQVAEICRSMKAHAVPHAA